MESFLRKIRDFEWEFGGQKYRINWVGVILLVAIVTIVSNI